MHEAWFKTFIKLIPTPSERCLSLLPLPIIFLSQFPPILPSPIPSPFSLSILLILVITDGMVNSLTNIIITSSTSCGTTGRAHMKKLTQRRTEGRLPAHILVVSRVVMSREKATWSPFQGPGYRWCKTIC